MKKTSNKYQFLKLNNRYYLYIIYKNFVDPYSKYILFNKLANTLENIIIIYRNNLYYTKKCENKLKTKI